MKCGHASGVTYSGCMKCDLDRQADRIRELEAELKQSQNYLIVCKKRNKNLMLVLHKSAVGEQE